MINDLSLENGNDLRVYFRNEKDCQPREIDRILENIATTKTRVLFKLQEDLDKLSVMGQLTTFFMVTSSLYRFVLEDNQSCFVI